MGDRSVIYISNQNSIDPLFKTCSIQECVDYLSKHKELAVDTETEGLFNHDNKIIMFQIGTKEKQFVIDARNILLFPFKDILENSNITKLFWNSSFDYKFLKMYGINVKNIWDGQLAEMILTTGLDQSVSLATCALKYLNVTLDKTVRTGFNKDTREFTNKEIQYGADDVHSLFEIKEKQIALLLENDLLSTLDLENKFVEVLANIEYNGFYLDRSKWLELESINKKDLTLSIEVLNNYVLENNHSEFIDTQLDLFNTDKKVKINWASPKQVIGYLKFLGVDTTKIDKGKIKESCDEAHLSKYKQKFEFIPLYLDYKKKQKEVSTYGIEFLENINKITGRVHSNFWQVVSTGRVSSSRPNLQNIPNNEKYRKCFIGQGNNMLVVADYSGQEQVILADRCKDPALLDFYKNGDGDMHCFIARKLYPELKDISTPDIKKFYNNLRQMSKIIGFTINYGGNEFTVSERMQMPIEEAKILINNYFAGFPKMSQYFKVVTKETTKKGYILIDNLTKRKSFLPFMDEFRELDKLVKTEGFWDKYKEDKELYKDSVKRYFRLLGEIGRLSQNVPIQGTAGSMTKLACIYIQRKLEEKQLHNIIKIVNIIHDEIILETTSEYTEEAALILKSSMVEAGKKFCKTVVMGASVEITKHWKH